MAKYFLGFFLFFISKGLLAQSNLNIQKSADSLLHIVLVESLRIPTNSVDAIFDLRESYIEQTITIRKNSEFSLDKKKNMILLIQGQTNQKIKDLIGEVKYKKYMEFIISRMRKMGAPQSAKPLAGG